MSGTPTLNPESGFNLHPSPMLYGPVNVQPEANMGFNPQIMYYNDVTMTPANGVISPELCSPQAILPNETDGAIMAADLSMNTPSELSSQMSVPPEFSEGVQKVVFQPNPLLSPPNAGNYHGDVVGASGPSPFPFEDNSDLPQDLSAVLPLQFESQNVNMEDYLGMLVSSPEGGVQNIEICENSSLPQRLKEGAKEPSNIASSNNKKAALGKRTRMDNQEKVTPSKMVARPPSALNLTGKEISEISSSPLLLDNLTTTAGVKCSSTMEVGSPVFSQSQIQIFTNCKTGISSGNQSDTSSGISSGSNKLSTSNNSTPSSSPFNTFSPVISDHSSLDFSPDRTSSEIIPIFEPHPGLGVKEEYMQTSPIRPPSPPPSDESIDLHPELPVFEVSTTLVCTCTCTHTSTLLCNLLCVGFTVYEFIL